ncbi:MULTISPECIES: SPOR domain-containing protein [unclassified Campylobacter]|uniref:SPOR domain-containing protein n=1 Tax=unclassified Campylobacter TaxID=2593542 RepID=UPI001237DDC7|nr:MULTISPECIES: SPOR domain-containing protein [unclassified Campylobacter]KAA6226493.1 SPOR domain-containing protein [Campylobacter sp. LR185c]KAA6228628.1 SPOR domain-containing protein [Campylobacter sp. LR196d]KAA6229181.1 SPOR domain-containing protein [Campylobacter sp. LR286c]KAA6233972.1 SPOR domain-containing protein [Campylobacter sp. LR291e]KAA8603452.1 SPOR domain-containing protein [Campylobacter sp. LR185c]
MENENKTEFDDIILEKSNKSEKIKKILLRVIALVILFLVILLVYKLFNGNQEKEIVPSEPISGLDDKNGFKDIPLTELTEEQNQFELLKQSLAKEENNEQNATLVTSEIPAPPPSEEINSEPPAPKQEIQKPTQSNTINVAKNEKQTKPATTQKQADSKELFKEMPAQKIEPVLHKQSGLPVGTYVQVFSVENVDKRSKDLTALKQKGYEYKLYKTKVNNKDITKVLIGPFSKDEVNAALTKIRKDVEKDAFVFTLKP